MVFKKGEMGKQEAWEERECKIIQLHYNIKYKKVTFYSKSQ